MSDTIESIEDVSIRPLNHRDAPHPIIIKESRYHGAYSGGEWVLVAGLRSPEAHTEAWGSDSECMVFWNNRESDGPAFTRQVGNYEKDVYAAAGNDPNELVVKLFQHYENDG